MARGAGIDRSRAGRRRRRLRWNAAWTGRCSGGKGTKSRKRTTLRELHPVVSAAQGRRAPERRMSRCPRLLALARRAVAAGPIPARDMAQRARRAGRRRARARRRPTARGEQVEAASPRLLPATRPVRRVRDHKPLKRPQGSRLRGRMAPQRAVPLRQRRSASGARIRPRRPRRRPGSRRRRRRRPLEGKLPALTARAGRQPSQWYVERPRPRRGPEGGGEARRR